MSTIDEIRARALGSAGAGDRAGAAAALEDLARLGATDKALQIEVLETMSVLGDFARAHEIATAALARFPDSPALNVTTARILLALGRVGEAADLLKTLCASKPEMAGVWDRWGAAAVAAGRSEDALAAFRGAVQRDPGAKPLWNSLGDAALRCARNDEAEAAFRKSLTLDDRQAAASSQLGRLLMKRGALDEAAHWLEKSIAADPALAASHLNLSAVKLKQGRRGEALAAAETVVGLLPTRAEGYMARGQALLDLGRYDDAVGAFQAATARDPANAEGFYGLARAHARAGRLAEATAAADRSLALRPNDGQVQHMRRVWSQERTVSAPDDYVRRLFDAMADGFDAHLQGTLSYNAPEQAAALLKERYPAKDRFTALCDVGCGTGLMAVALAPRYAIGTRIGIDLSPQMVALSKAKGLYSDLIVGEAVATLAGMERRFDLITALDMLIYVGDAQPFLHEAGKRLAPGGVLAASLETGEGVTDVRLELTARFSHNKDHFIGLAAARGLRLTAGKDVALRNESGVGASGYIGIFERD